MTQPIKDFPELLNDLFQTRRKPDGEPYTANDIAHWIEDNIPGAAMSPSYLSRLRSGDLRPNRVLRQGRGITTLDGCILTARHGERRRGRQPTYSDAGTIHHACHFVTPRSDRRD